jgi:iron complex outermembrane receptor protein
MKSQIYIRKPYGFARQPLALALSFAFASSFNSPALAQETTAEPVNVDVSATRYDADAVVVGKELAIQQAANVDTATLMTNVSGVAFQVGGAVSSIPVLRGLADDRISVLLDGVDALPACPNHMNTPLSYVDPSSIKSMAVYKSYKPVSIGFNSIGGAIVASTGQPTFAEERQNLITGNVGGFYNTNNNNIGANLSITAATDWLSLSYTASTSSANNYTAARTFHTGQQTTGTTSGNQVLPGNMVGSTSYESTNQAVALALKADKHTVQLKYSWQDIPYEGYVNQRMDLTGNQQQRYNLQYWGGYDWGKLEAQAYFEQLNHQMNFGPNKQYDYGNNTTGMPMNTNSNTAGVKVKGDIHLSEASLLRTGAEWQRYYLNDYWPSSGTAGMMQPYTFQNINGGLQQAASVFGEWAQRLTQGLKSELGVRYSLINSSTGNVHGYQPGFAPSSFNAQPGQGPWAGTGYVMPHSGTCGAGNPCNEINEAAAFNNGSRSATFNDIDIVLTTSYQHSDRQDMQLGLARQVRAPNLYELYTWSAWNMAAIMNNTVGDGNGYFGNPNLKPETAYTASAVYDLHTEERDYTVKASPFYSYVENYIDAVQWSGNSVIGAPNITLLPNQFVTMRYVNQNANLAGIDLDGQMPLAKTDFGRFSAQGLFNWTYGKNLVTGYGLYNVMPVNGKLNFSHQFGGWDNQLQFIAVANKNNFLSVERNEIATPGYFLTNLKASYSWSKVRVDAGINNLFNTFYYQPLGGAYLGQGRTMSMNPSAAQGGPQWGTAVPGMGISYYTAFNYKF